MGSESAAGYEGAVDSESAVSNDCGGGG
jgi:hypothetical protein